MLAAPAGTGIRALAEPHAEKPQAQSGAVPMRCCRPETTLGQ
jgi:hypothetical protein